MKLPLGVFVIEPLNYLQKGLCRVMIDLANNL